MRDLECKQIGFKKVLNYLKDSKISNPGNFHPMMEPETMYSDPLNPLSTNLTKWSNTLTQLVG